MKSKDVLQLLQITRPTLTKYVKEGLIKTITQPNGQYDYDMESVYKLFNKGIERLNYIYARVSNQSQYDKLTHQLLLLKQFCFANGWCVNACFTDVASGISFDKRTNLLKIFDDIIVGKVNRIVVTCRDRLGRVGFELLEILAKKHNTEIVVMSDLGIEELDDAEITEELDQFLKCYNINSYDQRIKILKNLI